MSAARLSFSPQPPPAAKIEDLSAASVLIVDDTASKRFALRAVLLPLGVSIVEADSGQAALRCVMAQDFAVILLDVQMPLMDGYETAGYIRQRQQSALTPIIFVTAHDSADVDRYAQGAVDFMCLPVIPAELRAKVSVFANIFLTADGLAARARAVETSANQLSVVADSAPIGIFQTDAKNRYAYTNPRWTEITGITSEQARGQPWDSIMRPEERPDLPARMSDDALGPAELSHRFEVTAPGSTARIALITSRPIVDGNGEPAGWVGTLADVTAEAGAEAAMSDARDRATEASRLKSDFLANMSHEIRTPMNGVIGMTELLLETDLDALQRDYAQTVRNSGEALLTIINDILDFSKVEAGQLEVESIDLDLRAIINDVVDLLARGAQSKKLRLIAVVEDALPETVSGDPGRVRQVLTNLIGNAIKFTQAGEIRILVTLAESHGPTSIIRIEVSDTGDGIAADKLAAVFQPFVQADTSTSRKYGGTGLGLAISAQLVALMGGDCGISSELGVGSTFWFTICTRTDAEQTQRPARPDSGLAIGEAPGSRGNQRSRPLAGLERGQVLLAEDNLINQKVAVAMLAGAGYRVDTVADGAAAVKAAAAHTYDVILMDCQMPELSGYEATAEIRAQEGSGPRVPIIAMTAAARPEDRALCLAHGMDGYLAKPVSKDTLLAMVATDWSERAAFRPPVDLARDVGTRVGSVGVR
jgi:PAS domain S-box-containing protein